MVISPDPVSPGGTVTITVTVNEVVTAPQVLTISASSVTYFTDLPRSVNVPANSNQAVFQATVSTSATGSATVTASCNGQSASGDTTTDI